MSNRIWIIAMLILMIAIMVWFFSDRQIKKAVDRQGQELIKEMNGEESLGDSIIIIY